MSFWPVVKKVVKDADIVLSILDARMPELSRNKELEDMVLRYGKILVYVYNKCDLISKEKFFELKRANNNAFFVSGIKGLGMSNLKKGLSIMAKRAGIPEPQIGVVGYPNVGKSAIINALAHSAKARVSNTAGTTKNIQWVKAGGLRILDSPGVVPVGDKESKLGLLSAKNPEKIKNKERVAIEIINNVLQGNRKLLEKFYDIKINDEDASEVITLIGIRKGHLVKGGIVDENRTVMQIIRDWNSGKLRT